MQQILLQNATGNLLQNATEVYSKCLRFFITKCDSFITKCDIYYKMQRLLQIVTVQWIFRLSWWKYETKRIWGQSFPNELAIVKW